MSDTAYWLRFRNTKTGLVHSVWLQSEEARDNYLEYLKEEGHVFIAQRMCKFEGEDHDEV